MQKNKSARYSIIIAVFIFAISFVIFLINYVRAEKKIENFNAALGKNEKAGFTTIVQTIIDDKELGTPEEQLRYANRVSDKNVVEIKEKMFATQVSDVYMNSNDYLGKTIKLEGIFLAADYSENETFYSVIRFGPGGCCGNDNYVGFEIKWPTGKKETYPESNSWVEAAGLLKYHEGEYSQYLYLELSSLKELSRRGAEYVLQ